MFFSKVFVVLFAATALAAPLVARQDDGPHVLCDALGDEACAGVRELCLIFNACADANSI